MGVVSLAEAKREREPHIEGPAHCVLCGHKWHAVMEARPYRENLANLDPFIECPACHATKGILTYANHRPGPHWKCNCGNALFHLTTIGIYCPNCGAWSDWTPEPPVKSAS